MTEPGPGAVPSGQAGPTPDPPRPPPKSSARAFRWQAFFQRSVEPLFVLDRRRRLLFVNRAWEELTGLTWDRARALACRREQPAAPDDPPEEVLAHALTPPPEVLDGGTGRARRLLPGPEGGRWWDVEFFPLRQGGAQGGLLILGRISPVPPGPAPAPVPVPEPLADLRLRQVNRHGLDLWSSRLPAVRRLAEQVRLAAGVTVPVLLLGEPGTGKQALARAIHYLGPSRERAFAALDCARLPPP